MAITTSTSINTPKATVCSKCGHDGGLLVLDANGRKVHFDGCPEGPAPEAEPVLIAHDPLSGENGPDPRAIARLREHGVEYTRGYRTPVQRRGEPVHYVGSGWEVEKVNVDALQVKVEPPKPKEKPLGVPLEGDRRAAQKPLTQSKRLGKRE